MRMVHSHSPVVEKCSRVKFLASWSVGRPHNISHSNEHNLRNLSQRSQTNNIDTTVNTQSHHCRYSILPPYKMVQPVSNQALPVLLLPPLFQISIYTTIPTSPSTPSKRRIIFGPFSPPSSIHWPSSALLLTVSRHRYFATPMLCFVDFATRGSETIDLAFLPSSLLQQLSSTSSFSTPS
jgi:hypothetical protein